tara:strand:- start:64 stop:405 length:342 start_codon:yes stop_codon:yes gene_type:complete
MKKSKIFVDIDETICVTPGCASTARDYAEASPIIENIEAVNRMYDEGNEITYWTARGSVTGIDWRDLTEKQLESWGAKYHNLILGKPPYDIYIDDKSINTREWERRGRCKPEL